MYFAIAYTSFPLTRNDFLSPTKEAGKPFDCQVSNGWVGTRTGLGHYSTTDFVA